MLSRGPPPASTGSLPGTVTNDALLDGEKSLRTDEARLVELATFEVAAVERNGIAVGTCVAGDLAKDEVVAGEIDKNQGWPALSHDQVGL